MSVIEMFQQSAAFGCRFLVSNSSGGNRRMARELRFRIVLPVAEFRGRRVFRSYRPLATIFNPKPFVH